MAVNMIDTVKKNDLILLLGKEKKYLIRPIKFSCEFGFCDLGKIVGKRYGIKVKIGKQSFTVVRPGLPDMLKKAKRGPQIILPKDAAAIVSVTGCSSGWKIVEAGTGSGFLAMFFANIGCKVYTYEKRKEFYDISGKNFKNFGFKNVFPKNADITKGIKEKDVNMVLLDMQNPQDAVKNAFKALLPGGWLAVYSMHVEEVKNVYDEIAKFDFAEVRILSNVQNEWQILGGLSRPKNFILAHTGFLTFARKL
jgi:tRNA (adenine57-N1/adenine58-N1)-methyltransferase catalytic subunit